MDEKVQNVIQNSTRQHEFNVTIHVQYKLYTT
jgi:hypothetical protein